MFQVSKWRVLAHVAGAWFLWQLGVLQFLWFLVQVLSGFVSALGSLVSVIPKPLVLDSALESTLESSFDSASGSFSTWSDALLLCAWQCPEVELVTAYWNREQKNVETWAECAFAGRNRNLDRRNRLRWVWTASTKLSNQPVTRWFYFVQATWDQVHNVSTCEYEFHPEDGKYSLVQMQTTFMESVESGWTHMVSLAHSKQDLTKTHTKHCKGSLRKDCLFVASPVWV